MLKKILSLSLITLILFQAIHFNLCTSYAWSVPWAKNKASENKSNVCEKKNTCGNIEELTCVVSKLKNALSEYGSQAETKVGKDCKYSIYMWDYVGLDEFPKKMAYFLNDAKRGSISTSAAINLTNEIGGIFNIDSDTGSKVLIKFLNDNSYYKFSKEELAELVENIINKENSNRDSINTVSAIGSVLGGVAGLGFAKWLTLATAGVLGVGAFGAVGIGGACYSAMSWWKSSAKNKKLKKKRIKIQNYASTLDQLLEHLRNGNWKYADSVLAQLNFDPEFHTVSVSMVNSKINYPEELKEEFDQRFKNLENKLTQMVNDNNNLDRRIDL